MKGRARRLRNFDNKAEAFQEAINKNTGFIKLQMDFREVKVGKGPFKRLIQKRHPEEYTQIKPFISEAIKELEKKPAKYFTIAELGYSQKYGIQEYKDKPTVTMLIHFFRQKGKPKNQRPPLIKGEIEEILKCKKLVGQYKEITEEAITKTIEELMHRFPVIVGSEIYYHNIIVLGKNRNGTLRLAISDH